MLRGLAFLLTLLAVGAGLAVATAPSDAAKKKACWERVLDDWSQDERIDGKYPAACLEEALQRVPADIRAYSNFEEQVRGAQGGRTLQNTGGSLGGGGGGNGPAGPDAQPRGVEPDTGPKDEGPIGDLLAAGGRNNADSVPLPLMILAALALALMTAGAAGLLQRKLKAQRARSTP